MWEQFPRRNVGRSRLQTVRGKENEEATDNTSSYFNNLGCEGEVRGRRKVWNKGGKGRVRGRILFLR